MENKYLGKGKASRLKAFRSKAPMQAQVIYKQSNLKWNHVLNEITLGSVAFSEIKNIGLIADAECGAKEVFILHGKESPDRWCNCGFYGYSDYLEARRHNQRGSFTLKVIASGKMFEYNKGYRYGHQRVEEVIVSACSLNQCMNSADRLVLDSRNDLNPICGDHYFHDDVIPFSKVEDVMAQVFPPEAPRIIVRSENPDITPWEPSPADEQASYNAHKASNREPFWESNLGVVVLTSGLLTTGLIGVVSMIAILESWVQ